LLSNRKIIIIKSTTQPRSLELFEFLGIIDPVMQRSIKPPIARMYKGPNGMKEFVMAPELEPTPAKPYVCEIFK
jgi:2-polyprenyl-6-methoxyphenol hydroxylase-like FAD-dependent oxidoreductase